MEDTESIISEMPASTHTLPHHPPNLPPPDFYGPQYFSVGGSTIGGNENNYYLIDSQSQISKPTMSLMGATGGLNLIQQQQQQLANQQLLQAQQQSQLQTQQKASSKSSTTSKSCSSTESQKIMMKNLIQQTNHSKI